MRRLERLWRPQRKFEAARWAASSYNEQPWNYLPFWLTPHLTLCISPGHTIHHEYFEIRSRPSAEPLFASVAEVYSKNAIAVVLTGGDGDGSFEVQIIKEKGGQIIDQDRPTSPDFSIPEISIKTANVDFILPLNKIGPKLIELVGVATGK